ncbi:MAG: response regulator [Desulfobacterales bacterium]|nr:response regulator [Desulfobacterales bacterium]
MKKILIVDDQPCVRELLSEELICEGYRVSSVGDAESVRGYIRSSRPDLVLLDLYLDGPEGWEVLRDIKRQDPRLPVVILTAYDSFVDDPRLAQADAYVIKSIDLGELKCKIADLFRQKSALHGTVEEKFHFSEVGLAHAVS